MPSKELSWKYVEQTTVEPTEILGVRAQSLEQGIDAVTAATGAQLALLCGAVDARSIIEIGTGLGVSGLWMLHGAPNAHLTSIDLEADHHEVARAAFSEAGHAAARVRLITGRALEVLPRMNEASYDVVLVDADPAGVLDYIAHAIRLVRVGGLVLVPHALWRDLVPDPAKRDGVTAQLRGVLRDLRESPAVRIAVSPTGDGLLQILTLAE